MKKRAQQLLDTKLQICSEVIAVGQKTNSIVKIGIVHGQKTTLFSSLLAEFSEQHHDIKIILSDGISSDISQELVAGKLNLGIRVFRPAHDEEYFEKEEIVELYDVGMYICATDALLKRVYRASLGECLRKVKRYGPTVLLEQFPLKERANICSRVDCSIKTARY